MPHFTFHRVLMRFHVAAAEGGFAVGEFGDVEHPVSIKEMIRALRDEVRVGAVADVGSSVEAAREWADDHLAGGGGELTHHGGSVPR